MKHLNFIRQTSEEKKQMQIRMYFFLLHLSDKVVNIIYIKLIQKQQLIGNTETLLSPFSLIFTFLCNRPSKIQNFLLHQMATLLILRDLLLEICR